MVKYARKKSSHGGLTIARAYRPPGSQRPEAVNELPNLSPSIIHPFNRCIFIISQLILLFFFTFGRHSVPGPGVFRVAKEYKVIQQ